MAAAGARPFCSVLCSECVAQPRTVRTREGGVYLLCVVLCSSVHAVREIP